MDAQEEALCRRTSALQDLFHWKSIEWEGPKFAGLKLTPSRSLSLSLCPAWKSRAPLKLGLLQKLAAITSGRVLNI